MFVQYFFYPYRFFLPHLSHFGELWLSQRGEFAFSQRGELSYLLSDVS